MLKNKPITLITLFITLFLFISLSLAGVSQKSSVPYHWNKQTVKQLGLIKPELARKIRIVLKDLRKQGYEPQIVEGLRTLKQQRQKVREGTSHTMHSKHLTGDAVDIADDRYWWNISVVNPFWLALGHEYIKQGLIWGGTWGSDNRLVIYELAVDKQEPGLITWFCDTAHGQQGE